MPDYYYLDIIMFNKIKGFINIKYLIFVKTTYHEIWQIA